MTDSNDQHTPEQAADLPATYQHTAVTGAINQHTPSYWRLALPALGARYLGRYVSQFMKDEHTKNKFFDTFAGLWMMSITGYFAYKTGMDMKALFSETVAYEFDKKAEDVTIKDLMQSQNKIVVMARKNFTLYNAMRVAVNSTFFTSYLPGKSANMLKLKNAQSVDFGIGANSVYLTSEILSRQQTFFEQVQSFVDLKLSSKNALGEPITATELMGLFQRNALDNDKTKTMNVRTHPEVIKGSRLLFERMADLMNETYLIRPQTERDNFALPKFLYLIGHNLLDPKKAEESLLYIEVANKFGIPVLKEVVRELHDGAAVDDLAKKYNVTLNAANAPLAAADTESPAKKFTDGMSAKNATGYTASAMAEGAKEGFVGRMKESQLSPVLSN